MNSSELKNRAATLMAEALSDAGFVLGKQAIIQRVSDDWETDFKFSISFYVKRNDGQFDIEPRFVVRLPYFEEIETKFFKWRHIEKTVYASTAVHEFYSHGFRPLCRNLYNLDIPLFSIVSDDDLSVAVKYYSNIVKNEVGEWMRQWGNWSSARRLMDADESIGGAWRNTAYFALLKCGFGERVACGWLETDGPITYTSVQREQIEFLRSICTNESCVRDIESNN